MVEVLYNCSAAFSSCVGYNHLRQKVLRGFFEAENF